MGLFDSIKSVLGLLKNTDESFRANEVNTNQCENRLPELIPSPHTSIFRYDDNEVIPEHYADAFNIQLKRANEYNIDYVEVVAGCCCSECAKYRNRVYCLSGKDKRFPILPRYIQENVSHCGFSIYPFTLGISYVTISENLILRDINEIVRYSNRLFDYDRTTEEKERYAELIKKRRDKYIHDLNIQQAIIEYQQIVKKLPEIAPKNQVGYSRMKKANSKNFQEILRRAQENNIEIKGIITEIDD